jgi:AcrR family transcriptional regulator
MPKGFQDHEMKIIKSKLIEQGRSLFNTHGLQKTSIQDITKKVGIAAGSFYKFFHSKEELYFEILELEESKIKEELSTLDLGNDPKEAIKSTILKMINTIENTPILQHLYSENTMEAVIRKLPPEKLADHFNEDADFLTPLIQKWENHGLIFTETPEIVSSILRSLVLLSFQKEKIGEKEYPETMQFFIETAVNGFLKEE